MALKIKMYSDIATSDRQLIHYFQVHSGWTVVHELFQLSGSGLGTVQKTNELMSQKEAKNRVIFGYKKQEWVFRFKKRFILCPKIAVQKQKVDNSWESTP